MTDTITLPRAVIEQALEALQAAQPRSIGAVSAQQYIDAITALRAALESAESVEQEPVAQVMCPVCATWVSTLGRPTPSVSEGWKPIETAPRVESVLLYCGGEIPIYCGRQRHGYLGEPQQDVYAWRCDSSGRFANPTHWMPLPAAPQPEGEK